MTTFIYKIELLTNLHAGSGDAGLGVVDKNVQRDPVTNLPTIHASSMKGALREHFEGQPFVERIFGTDSKQKTGLKQGEYRFFHASIIAIPMPKDAAPHFELITDHAHNDRLKTVFQALGSASNVSLNGQFVSKPTDFKEQCENLPVIARNCLENGVSTNLWYEEIVPHQSVFVTCIQGTDNELDTKLNGAIVQIGGNATVGYGYCKFTKIA